MVDGICETSHAPKAAAKEYRRDMGVAGAAYILLVIVGVYAIRHFAPPQWVAVILALLPIAPVLLMLRAYMRFVAKLDEFQRRIQSDAMLIAAGIVGFGSLTYGFLQSFADFPSIPDALMWVFPALCVVWGVAQIFVRRRYQ